MTNYAVRSGSQQSKENTRNAIRRRETFKTSGALRGERNSNGEYRVYSYAAIIALYTPRKRLAGSNTQVQRDYFHTSECC